MFKTQVLKNKIENSLKGSSARVENPRLDGQHFLVKVTWKGFDKMPLIKQHKKVHEALDAEFRKGLHSISLRTQIKE